MKYKVFEQLKDKLQSYNIESVAQNADVSAQTIYYWLAGKTKTPRIDTITKVASAIGWEITVQPGTKKTHLRKVA